MSWQAEVKNLGWEFLSVCNCGGVRKERWKKREYEIKVIKNQVFYLYHKGKKTNNAPIFDMIGIIQDI